MHLLAAKPGGFIEDEGIIDLDQTPADIVILSAADSSLAALAHGLESLPLDFATLRLANWLQILGHPSNNPHNHAVYRALFLFLGENRTPIKF
jgi:hypothetical protein